MSYSSLAFVADAWSQGAWPGLFSTLALWAQRARQRAHDRHALGLIDHWELRDLGPSRGEIEHELAKPFWRA